MNRKKAYLCLSVACLLAFPVSGQQQDYLFTDNLMDNYDKALELNDAKDYLEAYRQMTTVELQMDQAIHRASIKAADLADSEFNYYWQAKKSRAEIAYKLGNHSLMRSETDELKALMENRSGQDGGLPREDYLARIAKLNGSRCLLTEAYDSAAIYLNSALQAEFTKYDFEFFLAIRGDLAQLYYIQEKYDEAKSQLDSILQHPYFQEESRLSDESHRRVTVHRMEILSQRAICLARLAQYSEALKELGPILQYFKLSGDKRAYAENLRKKAKILMLQYDTTGQYNPAAKACYQEYLSISRDYIDRHFVRMSESEREQYWMAEQPFVTDCFRLEDKAPELLYDVALYSKGVLLQMGRNFRDGMSETERRKALAAIRISWQTVRSRLSASACAIEYVVYEKKGKNHIGAIVIRKNSTAPRFTDLGEVNSFTSLSVAEGYTVKEIFADTQSRDKINALYSCEPLRQLLWPEALISAIGNSTTIYFSPDGIFHQIGIEYLAPPAFDGRDFYRLTTTRLLAEKSHPVRTDRMLVCGGVEYGLSGGDREKGNDALAYSLLASMGLHIDPLPNSAIEVDSILAIRSHHASDGLLRADSVTEAALNKLLGKYHILHISTHGLFTEVAKIGTDIRPASADTQLSGSCLFLSGSENSLRQQTFDPSSHDGILSARELAKMNLGDIDLTVMSACMSGLGYITPDGVYGLQRGLKSAGVRSVVSTLWSVDDEATSFFIIQLYKNLESGHSLHKAFWTARESLKEYEKTYGASASSTEETSGSFTQRRRTTTPKFDKPYFYNAFILIDGTE